ncbi:Putative inorganic phosphate cotransporter [Araneus ventricosus]|uniref:Inorganic phosphate cotransporter n=1 Tax=Araneus ventricosus TaxID=182803 RepID=A0A4Y2CIG6_ARAVE|nr:Putative inorganic phosphate cotransporter [Araneus ventricosus]
MFHNIIDTVPERLVGNTDNLYFVLDGGSLIHPVVWPKQETFGDVYTIYRSYMKRHYSDEVTVVFDGYTESSVNTKNGLLSALPNLMLSIVTIFASIMADKLRKSGKLRVTVIRKIFNSIGFFGPAVCLVSVSLVGCEPFTIVILLSLAMGLNGFAYSGFICTYVDMNPDFAGTLYGISNCLASFTGFLVPAFVGWIVQDGQTVRNWGIVFITSSTVFVVTGLIYNIFCSAELQPWGECPKTNKKKPFQEAANINSSL